jgi:Uma2 family endonuclease
MNERTARRMTIDEFLTWQGQHGQRFELVNGAPVAMAGARPRHDRVTVNALTGIRDRLRAPGSPCDAFTADRTATGNLRRPEVSVLCPPFDEDALTSDRPRLVLEVLSGSTERVDRFVRLDEYQAIETLDTIIIADPAAIEVGVWSRGPDRAWRSTTLDDPGAMIDMPALGIAMGVGILHDRVQLTPRQGPRLVWATTPRSPPDAG